MYSLCPIWVITENPCVQFDIPLTDAELKSVPYYRPAPDSTEMQYMLKRRKELGGFLPQRNADVPDLELPSLDAFKAQLKDTGKREISSTMAFVRILSQLTKDKQLVKRIKKKVSFFIGNTSCICPCSNIHFLSISIKY